MKRTSISTLAYIKKECSKSLAFGVAIMFVATLYVAVLGTLLSKKERVLVKKVVSEERFIGPRSDALEPNGWPTNNMKLEVKAKTDRQSASNSISKTNRQTSHEPIKSATMLKVAKN